MSRLIDDRLQVRAERDAEMRGEYEPEPQRPGPIGGRTKAPAWAAPLIGLVAVGFIVALFQGMQPAPLAVPATSPTAAWAGSGEAPAPAPPVAAPTSEPPAPEPQSIGTGDGYLEPVEQGAPAGVPAAPAPQFVNPTPADLIPLPAEGWHPPMAEGAAVPTPDNFVMRREP